MEEYRCKKNGPLFSFGREFSAAGIGNLNGQLFHYRGLVIPCIICVYPCWDYQIKNASLPGCYGTADRKGSYYTGRSNSHGLAGARWPTGIVRRSPLVVIDGAHNAEAFQGLRNALQNTLLTVV